MERDQASELLEKYQRGECTPEEERMLFRAFNRVPLPPGALEDDVAYHQLQAETLAGIHRQLNKNKTSRLRRWLPYAAAVAILLSVGWLLLVDSRQSSVDSLAATEILPGGNRATLTLADGRVIDLSSEQAGIVIQDGITYLDGSQVMENEELRMKNEGSGEENGILNSQLSILNSITTPKGGTYQITLPDGSKVWLNSASTLKYPSHFTGDSREVFLEGEAYFEIKKIQGTRDTRAPAEIGARASSETIAGARVSRVPFIVRTAGQVLEVLGTQFNISAYPDEPETKTTLVEGSVTIVNRKSNIVNQLMPGEQATVRGAATETRAVDVQQYTAWKSGYFYFNGELPQSAFAQLSRWYDIELVYRGEVPPVEFYGKIERNKPLGSLLKILEKAGLAFEVVKQGNGYQLIIGSE